MDHSENDKRFCVYVLKDVDGDVRYVGNGTKYRPYVKNRNNKELAEVIDRLEPEVIESGLSKNDAIALESKIFKEHINSGKLLNKFVPSKVREILYDDIKDILYYDETSPTFLRWKVDLYTGRFKNVKLKKAGDVAGTLKSNGYVETGVKRIPYKNHRLIWVLCNKTDLISNLVIDHVDRNKSNNNINNLRLVTQKENIRNRKPDQYSSISGHEGIQINDKRCFIYVRWPVEFERKSKTFNYKNLFPNIDIELAKQKCIELAVWYRGQILTTIERN